MSVEKNYIDSLQVGRALAACAVALQHTVFDADRYYSRYTGSELGYKSAPSDLVNTLAAGVDVFFVISGIVMVLSTQSRPKPLEFLMRRAARIFPLWWLLTLVYIGTLLVAPQLFQLTYFDPVHAACSMLLVPCTGPTGEAIPLIYAGWTLTYELVFYALFALSLLAASKLRAILVCCALVSVWHLLFYTPLASIPAFYHSSQSILFEFLYGVMLGYIWTKVEFPRALGLPMLVTGLAGLAASQWVVAEPLPRFIGWGIPALLMVTGLMCLNKRRTQQGRLFRLGVYLGAASYSIYLFHFFSLRVFFVGLGKTGLLASVTPVVAIVSGLVFTLVASVVVYQLCEKPLLRLNKKVMLVLFPAILAGGCSSPGSDNSSPQLSSLETGIFCSPYDDGGVRQDTTTLVTLPATLQSGDRLVITSAPRGEISGFDEHGGTLSYTPPQSRLPDRIAYERRDGSGSIMARYEHYWIPQPLRIMPLGDSITSGVEFFNGTDFPPLETRVGYRKALFEQLVVNQQHVDFIGQAGQRAGASAGLADPDNNGFSGADIPDLTSKVQTAFNDASADLVLLHIGTNNTPEDASSLFGVLDEIDAWAENNHPVKVFVATLVPQRDPQRQAVVQAFNEDLRTRIATRARNDVLLVEQARTLTVDDISTEEVGVHPNLEGYKKMASTWYSALVAERAIQVCK